MNPPLVPPTQSQAIRTGNARNVLAVVAQGPNIALYINGTLVHTVQDSSVTAGKVGIFAGTQNQPPATVAFFRLSIYDAATAAALWGTAAPGAAATSAPAPATASPAPSASAPAGSPGAVLPTATVQPAQAPEATVTPSPPAVPPMAPSAATATSAASPGVLFADDFRSQPASQADG